MGELQELPGQALLLEGHPALIRLGSKFVVLPFFLFLSNIPLYLLPIRPLNPLGSRTEIQLTITWIKTHLEEDQQVSLPKHEVYDEYT